MLDQWKSEERIKRLQERQIEEQQKVVQVDKRRRELEPSQKFGQFKTLETMETSDY